MRIWIEEPSNNQSWEIPSWISYNESSGNFDVNTSSIDSVGSIHIYFQSQLISFSFANTPLDNTISTYSSVFNFENENWKLISSIDEGWYIVTNEIKSYPLEFSDDENDIISFRLADTGNISVFIQKQSNILHNFLMQCGDDFMTNYTLVIQFTDRYHKQSEYWTEIRINVKVFLSEPPKFADLLNHIIVDSCTNNQNKFELPIIIDPDSNNFTVSLELDSPDWIQIRETDINSNRFNVSNNKCYLFKVWWLLFTFNKLTFIIQIWIDTSDSSFPKKESILNVKLILSDDSGAFTKYNLNIDIKSASNIIIDHFDDAILSSSSSVAIPLNIEATSFSINLWDTQNTVYWIWYSENKELLYINNAKKWNLKLGLYILLIK